MTSLKVVMDGGIVTRLYYVDDVYEYEVEIPFDEEYAVHVMLPDSNGVAVPSVRLIIAPDAITLEQA